MRLLFRLFCFIAAALTPAAQAAQVTTTITGTLASGIDFTGVFGFPPNTDLTSQPYTLTYTFDDTKGTQSLGSCQGSSGVSSIMSTTTSNPGTAVLKIGTGAWTFGSLPAPFAESTDSRVVIGVTSAGPQSMTLTVDDSDNNNNTDSVFTNIYPATGTVLTTDCNWEAAFSNSQLSSTNPDAIDNFAIRFEPSSGAGAQGSLYPGDYHGQRACGSCGCTEYLHEWGGERCEFPGRGYLGRVVGNYLRNGSRSRGGLAHVERGDRNCKRQVTGQPGRYVGHGERQTAVVEFISPSQVNIQPPDDTAVGPVQVVVTTTGGGSSPQFTVNYAEFAPGLFPAASPYIVAQHADNSYVATATPAKPGEVIILWGTGFGPANPAVPAGQVFSGANPIANTVSVTIGGQPAAVDFAGVVGAGLVQINVHVPSSINNGDAAVVATVGSIPTQTTANLISIHN